VPAAHLGEVPQRRQVRVERVEQPEARDVGDREVGERLVALPPRAGERGRLRRGPLDEPAGRGA
jgi:hypothetical protein